MRRGTLVLGLLLALTACSVTVTVSLPDQTLDLPGLTDTDGKVVYPKDGLSFSPPPVDVVRGIRVEGVLEASQPLNITLAFYARTQDPSQDPACAAPPFPGVENIYLRVLPHSSTPAILSKTRLRMRLWTKRIRFTRAARPQKDRAARCFPDGKAAIR
jgi:hypothetical protein